ncbi:ABC transporter substrate-binding protein [Bacillus testis]|uniref:ABC transporter substrate-binding protein n=1 Tax=Bacillus testis TaxID=1622072 RepID=UPI00067E9028|nr:ABC transporter substrate-binding protein [Bacillus testis]
MKKKGIISLMLGLLLILSACSVKTKDDVSEKVNDGGKKEATEIEILSMSSNESDVNILRDQLAKNGFKVKLNLQPDFGSFKAQEDAGNFDVSMSSWTTVTGNPDYAVRSLFISGGDYSIISDSKLDQLINQASTQTAEDYKDTYKKLEDHLVFEKAYIAPLYISNKNQAINTQVLKENSVRLSKSRALAWDSIDYVDASKRDKRPLKLTQATSTLTSLDPIKGNDGSINQLNTNMYVRLVNLTDDDKITSDASLSLNHAIAEGNKEYYFVLRNDINFAKVDDKKAVDSGERVGAEDVIFSLNRAKDKNSVPDHRTYSLHEHIKNVEIVKDVKKLESLKLSNGEGTVKDALNKGLENKISELVTDKKDADQQSGKYQVVKLTTTEPFPQVLNYLAHQSAGIVSKKQVESINTYKVASFDAKKDIPYGDQNTVTEGSRYNNTLYASGPYIMLYKNDYEAAFQKNPAYMAGTDDEPHINQVSVRFIKDQDSAFSALRSGEIDMLYGVPETKFDILKADSKMKLQSVQSNGVSYLLFNTKNREVAKSENLRKAVLYSINQNEFIQFYKGDKEKAVSTVSPLVDTGNELKADPKKVQKFLKEYQAEK